MSYCIDQRQVPGISRLFADYLYAFERVGGWYGAGLAPFAPDALAEAAGAVRMTPELRGRLVTALAEGHRDLPPNAARAARLERLAEPGTVAIVAGQQVGLFGGPLLTIYKGLTAIRLADDLRAQGITAVPIFWLASQDHDLAEINHAWALDRNDRPHRITAGSHGRTGHEPVGSVRLGPEIESALDDWEALTGRQANELRASYRPEATFASAFRDLLAGWFEPWGLIFLDPRWPGLVPLAQPTLDAAIEQAPELLAALATRSRELEAAGYHAQVGVEDGAALLFGELAGERVALRRQTSGWRWGDEALTTAELRRRLAEEPERFSPAALLRPVVQDALLPTAAQVCGPAETAYLAQSAVLYRELGRRQPLLYPRVSATLLEARWRRYLEKYGLTLPAIWTRPSSPDPGQELAAALARQMLPAGIERSLAEVRGEMDGKFQDLAGQVAALDPTLTDFLTTAGGKIRHQLQQIEGRVSRALARRQEDLSRHAQALAGALYPERHLQERMLAGAAQDMPALLARLATGIVPRCPDHQAIEL